MAARVSTISGHLIPRACAGSTATFDSPTGKVYPPGTAATLKGNLEPVQEEVAGLPLKLIFGALPSDLDGKFVRNGPNPFLNRYDGKPYHEFEGDGMIHSVGIQNGKAIYTNRWIRTKRFEMDREKGKRSRSMDYMGSDGVSLGSANTSLVYHAKQLLALYETDRPYVISAPSLETLGQLTYGGHLHHGMTAHPKVCPETGEMMFFGYSLMEPKVTYGVANPQGERTCTLEVPTRGGRPVMMHDMAITKHYSILLEFPLYFDMQLAMKGTMPFIHDGNLPSMFGIMPRHAKSADEIKWFSADTAMAFHIANAWEEDDTVKIVGCPAKSFSFEYAKSSPSRLYEWSFDLRTGKTVEKELDSTHVEFPVVHPSLVGSPNRYIFAARFTGGAPPFFSIDGCVKYDLKSGSMVHHSFLDGRWGGECVFVPRASATEEDDGYLLTYTFNPKKAATELYILDAKAFAAEPIAILETPKRIPFGFHGLWLSRSEC
eukprot:TRINITY_DN6153_c3_g1_i1.p1 TRINITY_DN6153_c3_g1~~TRINITY_DN6153_c3_g1_i1.p1  ORF type:complete len:499 (+),score=64.25 TRINITY_DN6153_c3_g1_i1:34-1497(+)